MDRRTADILIQANNRFYETQAHAFGKTRNNKWPGWETLLGLLQLDGSQSLNVLDVACGNMRFEAFLQRSLPHCNLHFSTVDNAPFDECQRPAENVMHQEVDILDALLRDDCPTLGNPPHQLAVSFGFLHHVPGLDLRIKLLQTIANSVQQGGHIAVSLWRFLDNDSLESQAARAWEPACAALERFGLDRTQLEPGDAFLGWDGKDGVWRYCHSFSDADIDRLADALSGRLEMKARFRADGRSGDLNEYLLFQKL